MNRTVTVAPSRPRLIVHFMSSPRECRDGGSRATASKKKSPIKDIVIEPKAGGRWYERGEGRRATVIASLNAATGPIRSRTRPTISCSIALGDRSTPALAR